MKRRARHAGRRDAFHLTMITVLMTVLCLMIVNIKEPEQTEEEQPETTHAEVVQNPETIVQTAEETESKYKGWKELIAGAIDNAYEKMIATTPPTTEEEQTHCEMIKEAVKGMFINESRTAAEAEFIKTHIVDYEKIFDVCMNGDDLEFKKGLVRLQKMQNEYVMQREND